MDGHPVRFRQSCWDSEVVPKCQVKKGSNGEKVGLVHSVKNATDTSEGERKIEFMWSYSPVSHHYSQFNIS